MAASTRSENCVSRTNVYVIAVNLKQEIPVQNVPPLTLALMKV
jgi:hypothetical protein